MEEDNLEKIIQTLLGTGVDINALDHNDNTPLHFALMNNERKKCLILVKYGARLDIKNKFGATPLMLAQSLRNGDQFSNELIEQAVFYQKPKNLKDLLKGIL